MKDPHMLKVRCEVGEGLGPSEKVVRFKTLRGTEELLLSEADVPGQNEFQAREIAREGDNVLLELPRETMSGRWRVWIPVNTIAEPVV